MMKYKIKKSFDFYFICLLIQAMIFFPSLSNGQISIDVNDMPKQGDTIRLSTTIDLDGIDYEVTGSNITWDFSSLGYQIQQVDTFVSTTSTPIFYQIVFNPLVSNLARKGGDFTFIPGFSITDIYQYFNAESVSYKEVGLGVTLEGVPLPMKYSNDDVIYRFPLSYGDKDSSMAIFEFSFPGLGYIGIEKKRNNIVDGYGSLITPLGQFDVIRLHSVIQEYDTAYIDSLGTGFGITRNYEEFKWLAKDMGIPVLTVFREGLAISATYQDVYRPVFSIGESVNFLNDISIFPNPADKSFNVAYYSETNLEVRIDLIAVDGKIASTLGFVDLHRGENSINLKIDSDIPDGVYVLRLKGENAQICRKVMIR